MFRSGSFRDQTSFTVCERERETHGGVHMSRRKFTVHQKDTDPFFFTSSFVLFHSSPSSLTHPLFLKRTQFSVTPTSRFDWSATIKVKGKFIRFCDGPRRLVHVEVGRTSISKVTSNRGDGLHIRLLVTTTVCRSY